MVQTANNRRRSQAKLKILLTVLFILVLSQAFNGGLSITSLEKLYFNSLIAKYEVIGNDLRAKILSALRFGKKLDKFLGITPLMTEVRDNLPDLATVVVLDADGVVLHSLDKSLVGGNIREIAPPRKSRPAFTKTAADARVLESSDAVYILLPLQDNKGLALGTVGLSFKRSVIEKHILDVIVRNLERLALATVGAGILLIVGLLFLVSSNVSIRAQKRRLYAIVIVTLVSAQIVYSLLNVALFRDQYLAISRDKVETLTALLQNDINYLLNKGIAIEKLVKIDAQMAKIIAATPEITEMSVQDTDRVIWFEADKNGVVPVDREKVRHDPGDPDAYYDLMMPLSRTENAEGDEQGGRTADGYIKVRLSREVIGAKVREIMLDSGTVVLISFLFVFELMLMLFISLDRPRGDVRVPAAEDGMYGIIRPAAFMYLMAMSLSQSFIPLQMSSLYQPFWGISREVILGLPISAEMLMAALCLIPVGIWMDRRGWHPPFLLGLMLSITGAALSGLAGTGAQFILARGMAGLGYGCTWLSLQGFVFAHTGPHSRAQGIANLVAGIFAGQICGAAVGGMVAERIGYATVFFIAVGCLVLILGFSLLFLREYFIRPETTPTDQERLTMGAMIHYLFDRQVFSVLWLGVIPLSICIVGVLFYLSPIYMKSIGSSQSDIGRAIMVFGLFSIYIAPWIGKQVDRSEKKNLFIFSSGVIASLGLIAFERISGVGAVVLAITMLGLASSLGASAQAVYALGSPAARKIGTGKALSIQRTVDKIGQMLGPLVVGGLVTMWGLQSGLFMIGIAYLAASCLFLLISWSQNRPSAKLDA